MSADKLEVFTPSVESNESEHDLSNLSFDSADLNRLGKKSVLRRDFGFVSMLGLSCTIMITWEGTLVAFALTFPNGGYAGSFWGYLLVWLGTLSSFVTMGELSSMAPTAGGQYHWTAMLAPRSINRFLSYYIGWMTFVAWQFVAAAGFFLCATFLQGLILMGNANWNAQQWQIPLFLWIFILLAVFCNTVANRALPKIESMVLILHIFGFLGILIPLATYGPSPSITIETVFTTWLNEGMWPTQGLSFMIGLTGPASTLLGGDCAVHMAEEVKSPANNVPRAMVFSIFLNGLMAIGLLVVLLFSLDDPDTVLAGPFPYAFMNILLAVIPSTAGAISMAAVVSVLVVCATISFTAVASRLTWAFARDRGLPAWRILAKIEPRTRLPLASIILTMVFSFLMSLIIFGSAVVFTDLGSFLAAGLYTSYFCCNILLLWRRIRRDIKPYNSYDDEVVNIGPEKLTWGPWRISEPFGTINNAICCAYLGMMVIFMYFPATIEPIPATMNWSILMVGAVSVFAIIYYWLHGSKSYKGPVIDLSD